MENSVVMNKLKIKYFIFSWNGQYNNTIKLEKQLKDQLGDEIDLTIINSDEENTQEHWINISNDYYFSSQFRIALNMFDENEFDVFFHIQADAFYPNFDVIVESANKAYKKYNFGVYAPNVDDTFYIPSRTDVFPLDNNLALVATTDNTCWFIHKDFIAEMIDNLALMNTNELGWGWDLLICAFSHMQQRKVIRDYNFTISHPPSTGYKKEQAEEEMQEMYNKCPDKLKTIVYYIKVKPTELATLYGISVAANDDELIIYDTSVR